MTASTVMGQQWVMAVASLPRNSRDVACKTCVTVCAMHSAAGHTPAPVAAAASRLPGPGAATAVAGAAATCGEGLAEAAGLGLGEGDKLDWPSAAAIMNSTGLAVEPSKGQLQNARLTMCQHARLRTASACKFG